jgi:multidrug efflux pump subunit AcrB
VVDTRNGADICLRDVGEIHDDSILHGLASTNGRLTPLVAVTAWPGKLTAEDLRKTLVGIKDLPEGVKVELVADTSAGGMAVVNIRLPASASRERTQEVVSRVGKLLGEKVAVKEWIAFGEQWEPNVATMLLKLPQENAKAVADARKALLEIQEAICVVSEVSAEQRPFPVRIAVCDTKEQGQEELVKAATSLADRMKVTNSAVDVTALPGPPQPELHIQIDRVKMKALGVSLDDVVTVIRVDGGVATVNDFNKFGREFTMQVTPPRGFDVKDWLRLEVRGANDKRVRLGTFLSVKEVLGSRQVLRVNLYPAVVLSANPPADVSVSDATAKSLKLAETELPKGYKAESLLPASR